MKPELMKILLSFLVIAFLSSTTHAQEVDSWVKSTETLANANIPEGASSVVSYTYRLDGCILIKTTLLIDETTYDREYDLTKKIVLGYYDTEGEIYDVDIEDTNFVLAFKEKKDALTFIKLLKKIGKKCEK